MPKRQGIPEKQSFPVRIEDGQFVIDHTDDPTRCDHVAYAGEGWKKCGRCGSTCTRGHDGLIEIYSRGTADLPAHAQPKVPHWGDRELAS